MGVIMQPAWGSDKHLLRSQELVGALVDQPSRLETAFLGWPPRTLVVQCTRAELLTSGAAGEAGLRLPIWAHLEGRPRPAPGAGAFQAEEQRLCPHPRVGRRTWLLGGIWGAGSWGALLVGPVHGQLRTPALQGLRARVS